MKKASRIMYILGIVFNIFSIVANFCAIFLGYYVSTNALFVHNKMAEYGFSPLPTVEELRNMGTTVLSTCIFALALAIVMIVFAVKAKKAIEENKLSKKLNITMIVFGALDNLFYLLGGIFGLVAEDKPQQQEPPKEVEIKIEENK